MPDPHNLQRFLDAQSSVFDEVRSELLQGHKRTHWMWFIFPQAKGLGNSEISRRFAISSLEEARAYLDHPILGARLRECTELVNLVEGRSAYQIFGNPDYMKFQSSMTLFNLASIDNIIFEEALTKYFDGKPDQVTLKIFPRPA